MTRYDSFCPVQPGTRNPRATDDVVVHIAPPVEIENVPELRFRYEDIYRGPIPHVAMPRNIAPKNQRGLFGKFRQKRGRN